MARFASLAAARLPLGWVHLADAGEQVLTWLPYVQV
jgi:hypothetical protein